MLLSVIIPFYNNPAALERCLASFSEVQQPAGNVEFIVVDDGSDSPLRKQRQHLSAASFHFPLSVFSIAHNGAAAARNEGLAHATGDFVWFFDADDTVAASAFETLLRLLTTADKNTSLFHTGPMVDGCTPFRTAISKGKHRHATEEETTTTATVPTSALFIPQTAYLDHTTYIIRRSLLTADKTLRYPRQRVLEDAIFTLKLLESVDTVCICPHLRPYIRHNSDQSISAGAWSRAKSFVLMPDICHFFEQFRVFLENNPTIATGDDCYRRLRYVYMRMLCVKGCPWQLIAHFKQSTQRHPHPTDSQNAGLHPTSLKEFLFFYTPFGRVLAFLCRLFRKADNPTKGSLTSLPTHRNL